MCSWDFKVGCSIGFQRSNEFQGYVREFQRCSRDSRVFHGIPWGTQASGVFRGEFFNDIPEGCRDIPGVLKNFKECSRRFLERFRSFQYVLTVFQRFRAFQGFSSGVPRDISGNQRFQVCSRELSIWGVLRAFEGFQWCSIGLQWFTRSFRRFQGFPWGFPGFFFL